MCNYSAYTYLYLTIAHAKLTEEHITTDLVIFYIMDNISLGKVPKVLFWDSICIYQGLFVASSLYKIVLVNIEKFLKLSVRIFIQNSIHIAQLKPTYPRDSVFSFS